MLEEQQENEGFHSHKAGVHAQSSQTQPSSRLLRSGPGQQLDREPREETQWPAKPVTQRGNLAVPRSLGVGLDPSDAYGGWFGNILGLIHTHKLLCIKYAG